MLNSYSQDYKGVLKPQNYHIKLYPDKKVFCYIDIRDFYVVA